MSCLHSLFPILWHPLLTHCSHLHVSWRPPFPARVSEPGPMRCISSLDPCWSGLTMLLPPTKTKEVSWSLHHWTYCCLIVSCLFTSLLSLLSKDAISHLRKLCEQRPCVQVQWHGPKAPDTQWCEEVTKWIRESSNQGALSILAYQEKLS